MTFAYDPKGGIKSDNMEPYGTTVESSEDGSRTYVSPFFRAILATEDDWTSLHPDADARRPDRRWQIAVRLAHGRFVPQELIDSSITVIAEHIAILMADPTPNGMLKLGMRNWGVVDAIYLRFGPNVLLRWELEAWILTDQLPEEIAGSMGLEPELIEIYEDTFFDVRNRLSDRDYITRYVIPPSEQLDDHLLEILMKANAYDRGPEAFAEQLESHENGPEAPHIESVLDFSGSGIEEALLVKAAIAAETLPAGPRSPQRPYRSRLHSCTTGWGESSDHARLPSAKVRAMLDSLPWRPESRG